MLLVGLYCTPAMCGTKVAIFSPTTIVFQISQTLKQCGLERKPGSGFHTVLSVMTEELTPVSLIWVLFLTYMPPKSNPKLFGSESQDSSCDGYRQKRRKQRHTSMPRWRVILSLQLEGHVPPDVYTASWYGWKGKTQKKPRGTYSHHLRKVSQPVRIAPAEVRHPLLADSGQQSCAGAFQKGVRLGLGPRGSSRRGNPAKADPGKRKPLRLHRFTGGTKACQAPK